MGREGIALGVWRHLKVASVERCKSVLCKRHPSDTVEHLNTKMRQVRQMAHVKAVKGGDIVAGALRNILKDAREEARFLRLVLKRLEHLLDRLNRLPQEGLLAGEKRCAGFGCRLEAAEREPGAQVEEMEVKVVGYGGEGWV